MHFHVPNNLHLFCLIFFSPGMRTSCHYCLFSPLWQILFPYFSEKIVCFRFQKLHPSTQLYQLYFLVPWCDLVLLNDKFYLALLYLPFTRYAYPWWRDKEINSEEKRSQGLCPLTPEETALILQALRFDKNVQIYIASGEIYGSERRLAALRAAFPNTVSDKALLSFTLLYLCSYLLFYLIYCHFYIFFLVVAI